MKIKNIVRNLSIFVLVTLLMVTSFDYRVNAATFGVSASSYSVQPGQSFTVYVNLSAPASGVFYVSGTNVSLNSTTCEVWGSSGCSVTATAISEGNASVTITAPNGGTSNEVTLESNDELVSGSKTVNVSVKRPTTSNSGGSTSNNGNQTSNNQQSNEKEEPKKEEKKNSDSSLASLSVSNGKLSPSFSAGTTSYKVSLPSTASSIKISASARDSKASVSGVGTRELEPGNNKLSVVCSAEDGSTTTYTINVYVDEKPLTYVTYNGTKLGVSAQNEKGGKLSKTFDETKIKINGIEVPAWKNKALNITLVYLQSEGIEGYYMYDEAKQEIVSVYEPMAVLGQNIVRVDVPENLHKREGMKFTKIKVDGKEFPGWTFEDKSLENYALIYVMNDAGKYEYYQYEKTQNTLQLYSGSAPLSQESYLKYKEDVEKQLDNSKTWNVILGILAGLFAVGMISSIVFAFKKKNTSLKYEKVNIPARKISKASNIEADNLINKSRGEE